jgi:hypothetical protein
MKAVAAVLVTLLVGAAVAEADWNPTKKLPKPIDYPMVRPKIKDVHKHMKLVKHPPKYTYVIEAGSFARA